MMKTAAKKATNVKLTTHRTTSTSKSSKPAKTTTGAHKASATNRFLEAHCDCV